MKTTGIILIIWGVLGIIAGGMMFGDIGVACIFGAVVSLIAGIGFLKADKQYKKIWKEIGNAAE